MLRCRAIRTLPPQMPSAVEKVFVQAEVSFAAGQLRVSRVPDDLIGCLLGRRQWQSDEC